MPLMIKSEEARYISLGKLLHNCETATEKAFCTFCPLWSMEQSGGPIPVNLIHGQEQMEEDGYSDSPVPSQTNTLNWTQAI